ncbi:MAG TPA: hypothetical protein DCX22_02620 [Dehalococcoidia bacterium]|nr:hypothetical protein [Dehalococcoidia bacterium]
MDFEAFLTEGLHLTGTFNPTIAIILFLICFIGEAFAFAIPYLLETTWLLVGYQFTRGILSPFHLLLLVMMTVAGREAGALFLYWLSSLGSKKLLEAIRRFTEKISLRNESAAKAFAKINLLSSLSVATGRLFWLRVPLTLVLSVQRKLRVLALGVLISALIWDCSYIIIGAIFGTAVKLEPGYMILVFLSGLTVLYVGTFVKKRMHEYFLKKRQKTEGAVSNANEKLNS